VNPLVAEAMPVIVKFRCSLSSAEDFAYFPLCKIDIPSGAAKQALRE
jgi:hypothetical protein